MHAIDTGITETSVSRMQPLGNGTQKKCFMLQSAEKAYVVKVSKRSPRDEAVAHNREVLREAGVPIPQTYLSLVLDAERKIEVKEFLHGCSPTTFMESETAREVGVMIGKMHDVAITHAADFVPLVTPKHVPSFKNHMEGAGRMAVRRVLPILRHEPGFGIEYVGRKAQEKLGKRPPESLPSGLLHSDLQAGNIMRMPDGTLSLIDWDNMRVGRYVDDLAHAIAKMTCAKDEDGYLIFRPDLADAMCEGYQSQRTISCAEMPVLMQGVKDSVRSMLYRTRVMPEYRHEGKNLTRYTSGAVAWANEKLRTQTHVERYNAAGDTALGGVEL